LRSFSCSRVINAGCVPDGCTWRLSRAGLWQPKWVFWLQWERSNFKLLPHGQSSCTLRSWDRHPPQIQVVNNALVAYSGPLRGKQQGLGTKLSHAKNRGQPSCSCAWPPRHISLIGGMLTIVTPPPRMDGFHEPRSLNPAPHGPGDELDRGYNRVQNLCLGHRNNP